MKKIILGILVTALVAAGVIVAIGQSNERHGPRKFGERGHHRGGFGMMFRGLDLTDEQKAKLKKFRTASRTNMQPTREALKANREKMQELTANGAFDEAQVTALANEQAALQAKMIVERQRMKAKLFSILTDEQKAKMAEMKAKRFERRKAHRSSKAPEVSE